jgi:hypothetical protein
MIFTIDAVKGFFAIVRIRLMISAVSPADERVAAEMGRVLLAIYRAGLQVRIVPDALRAQARAWIRSGPRLKGRTPLPRSTTGVGDSPLAAICDAVERLNQAAGAIVVRLD